MIFGLDALLSPHMAHDVQWIGPEATCTALLQLLVPGDSRSCCCCCGLLGGDAAAGAAGGKLTDSESRPNPRSSTARQMEAWDC